MTPLEFLAAVLPSPGHGYYCAVELSTKKEHQYSTVLDTLENDIKRWDAQNADIFFAVSTFEERGSREKVNARYIRSFFLDMDGYATKKEAAQALSAFMDKTGLDLLGTPYLVSSGGGLHAYWPLTEDIEVARWIPVAEAFKRLCLQEEFRADKNVTADVARILRVPGTRNHKKKYKTPRNVTLLAEGDTFVFEDFERVIMSTLKKPVPTQPAAMPLMLAGERPATSVQSSSTLTALIQNSVTRFSNIYKKTKAGTGCGQLEYYQQNAAEDGMEPLWRGMLSIAQKCEDGDRAVIWLSKLHPYDEERMHRKLQEIKGPYPCTKFDSENPGICEKCPHWGKITNPLALGREYALDVSEKEIHITPPAAPSANPQKIKRPEAPYGFAYGQNGGVFMDKETLDAQGNIGRKQVLLCQYDLFPIDILATNGVHEVHFMMVRNGKMKEVLLPQKCVASKDETIKHLAGQNVLAASGQGNDKNFYDYIRACVEKMSVEREPVEVPPSYGWTHDDGFVFAGKVYRANQMPVAVPMPDLANIVTNTQPTGSLENWRKVIELLVRKRLWDHLAVVLLGAGAPLMRFTGLFGVTVHCASSESGTGKSFALDTAASVWGHPIHYRTGSGTSAVAMQQRLGLLQNLPLVTDEITTNNRKDFEWFPAFLFSMTEGRGKERMEAGTNKERLNLSTWATIALMSSNRGAIDYLTAVRQHSSEGEVRRLLEFTMDVKLEWTAEEIEIIKSLQKNYAVAGEVLAQYFVDNVDYLRETVPQTVQQMYSHYGAPNDERFWMAGVGLGVMAGILFSSKHTGLADLPMGEIMKAYGNAVNCARRSISENKRSAEDILNAYIQENQGRFVVVKFGEKAGPLAHFHDGSAVGRATTRAEVMGRVEHGATDGFVDFYIEERLLRAYCSNMSFSYTNFKAQIQEQFVVSYMSKKDMTAKTDAPQMRVAAVKISRRIGEEDVTALLEDIPLALN